MPPRQRHAVVPPFVTRAAGLFAVAATAVGAAPAAAGAASPGERPEGAETGGTTYLEAPEVRRWSCLLRCGPEGEGLPRGLLRLRGRALQAVTRVIYHGGPGVADDVAVRVRPRGPRRVTVRVHADAVSGPVTAVVSPRLRSVGGPRVEIHEAPESTPERALTAAPALRPVLGADDPAAPRLETGIDRVRAFYGERSGVTFSYRVSAPEPVSVQVELVRPADGTVVRAWPAAAVPLGERQSVTWRGTEAGSAAPAGRYAFRLIARASGGVQAQSAQATGDVRDAFDFHDHLFPVRGRHDFGGAGARFGTGRSGHAHQGQDLFASCGTRLVAARGGVVKFVQYHAAAGHYVVVEGEGIEQDYVYMHLQDPPPVRRGQRIYTGQPLGAVGASGNARGCHLHFELWGAPGWYDGGRALDPLPALRAWDAAS